jgi:hypothetical protein
VLPFCAVRLRNLLPKQFLNMTVTNEMQEQWWYQQGKELPTVNITNQ